MQRKFPGRSEPVIGDAHDMETYGRPSAARAKAPDAALHRTRRRHASTRSAGSDRVAATEIAPFASAAVKSAPARPEPAIDNDAYEARLVERDEAVRAAGQAVKSGQVRTVKIRGQVTPARRRPAVQIERYDQHPDRAAQWALFLGVFMVVVAIVTGT